MENTLHIFLFGDQTFNVASLLRDLLHAHDDPILAAFFERSGSSIRRAITELDREQQEVFPRFSKLTDLLPYLEQGRLNPALIQYLTCVCQLAYFMREHGIGGKPYPLSKTTCLAGLCTGLVSAAAISTSLSLSDLVPRAVQAALVAFRTGLRAWETSKCIMTHGAKGNFSTKALSGVSRANVTEALQKFTIQRNLAPISAPFVSAEMSPTQVTISGSPDAVESFLQADLLLKKPVVISLPITAAYHAPQLFSHEDVNDILEVIPTDESPQLMSSIPVVSSCTGTLWPEARCFRDSLALALEEILLTPINWQAMVEGLTAYLTVQEFASYSVAPIATTGDRSLRSAISESLQARQSSSTPLYVQCRPAASSSFPKARPLSKAKIAIIGVSGRLPKAPSMDQFWDVLAKGMDVHEIVPPSRWNHKTHVDTAVSRKNVSGTGFGCWLEDAAAFDARYFNMSPREAPQVDPAQRLALLTATEAMEQAGIVPNRTPSTQKERVGVYFGCTSNDWMETNSAQNIDTYFIPGGNRAFIPGRINYHFKFSGPSYTIDTACSSSFAAIHMACNALWRNEVDTAIVGGTNVLTNPDMTAGLDRGHFLSRTGNCKTFDENADGYCRGEAVVTAILKRLDDAKADSDPIQACIIGIATNHNADADSITRPHVESQRMLFRGLLNETGVDVRNISYVELHGTGTQAGDVGETNSVLEIFAPQEASKKRKPEQRLYIGAAKANFGHAEAAAGVTSLAKVVAMMKHDMIPPHCGIKTKINPKIPDLASRNTYIADTLIPWPRQKGIPRHVFLNNFSAAGGNTALILEDAPDEDSLELMDPRKHHVVAVSAKTPLSLENNLKNMIQWIEKAMTDTSESVILPQLSYTTTARRIHHAHRVMVAGANLPEVKAALSDALQQKQGSTRPRSGPELVFTFTGQGAQYQGMGCDLYNNFASFNADIQRYDRIVRKLGFPSIKHYFISTTTHTDHGAVVTQLASVSLQLALYRLWTSFGLVPKAVVGHSLGEYAALHAAGVLSESDTLYLVGTRARLLEESCEAGTHAMLAVQANPAGVESVLRHISVEYQISCINGANATVLGGLRPDMITAADALAKVNIKSRLLETEYAFHTSQVDPILDRFRAVTKGVQFLAPRLSFVSPAYGIVYQPGQNLPEEYLVTHCRGHVDLYGSLLAAQASDVINSKSIGIEIGPAPVVATMLKDVLSSPSKIFASLQPGRDTWKLLSQILAQAYNLGADVHWSTYHRDFKACHKCLEIPAYSWDLKDYWIQYVHDWSLRKGDPVPRASSMQLSSSSVHKMTENTLGSGGDILVVESDLSREDLHPMVQGHQVYGVPLCTPSVYADIAMTIARYLNECYALGSSVNGIDISHMTIQSALVANAHGATQLLRTTVKVDWSSSTAVCTFSSVDANGKLIEQHSHCTIRYYDKDRRQLDMQGSANEVMSRMNTIANQVTQGSNTYRFSKGMIYKMIGKLADFDPNYRGLVEITLDNDNLEAVGKISFENVMKGGEFHTNPAYIDALSQLGGFVMNANEEVNLDKEVFVNHGWDSFELYDDIDHNIVYRSHVKMHEAPDKLWKGDVTIFDGEKIVAKFGGVALQGVPKRLMHYIVNAAGKRAQSLGPAPVSKQTSPPKTAPVTTVLSERVTQAVQVPAPSNTMSEVMKVIAEESGLAMDDLTDDAHFSDIGIDSLLSMVISSRFRDELELDFQSSIFTDFTTIGEMKVYIQKTIGQISTVQVTETAQEVTTEPVQAVSAQPSDTSTKWTSAKALIAEESGLALDDLTDDSLFADIGIDSLLSLVICSRFRDELELEVSEGSLFVDYPTMGALKQQLCGKNFAEKEDAYVGGTASATSASQNVSDSEASGYFSASSADSSDIEPDEASERKRPNERQALAVTRSPIKSAWSMVLQGMPKRAEKILFLFPDGCGAATSYSKLPTISKSTAVIGFNSPFMKNPMAMTEHNLPSIVASYVEGLRRHQPHGPYHLGGWSAGGILAYAVAQVLIKSGQDIASLILIDSPAPTNGLDRLPQRFFDHCASVGLFGSEMNRSDSDPTRSNPGSTKVPEWLVPHFEATITLFNDYHAPKWSKKAKLPKVNLIWAGECALDGVRYAKLPPASTEDKEDSEGMKFLTERRTDFGPGAWADLFPAGHALRCEVAEGEHHFSMMRDEGAKQLVAFLRSALDVAV